jgi:hypothetical protein
VRAHEEVVHVALEFELRAHATGIGGISQVNLVRAVGILQNQDPSASARCKQ